jgi:hypothetical protein
MPLMLSELYDALLDAHVDEAKARKAAEAVASYDARFAAIDTRLATMTGALDTRLATIEAAVASLKSGQQWLHTEVLVLLALVLALFGKVMLGWPR